jgi:hypothetical protein
VNKLLDKAKRAFLRKLLAIGNSHSKKKQNSSRLISNLLRTPNIKKKPNIFISNLSNSPNQPPKLPKRSFFSPQKPRNPYPL